MRQGTTSPVERVWVIMQSALKHYYDVCLMDVVVELLEIQLSHRLPHFKSFVQRSVDIRSGQPHIKSWIVVKTPSKGLKNEKN